MATKRHKKAQNIGARHLPKGEPKIAQHFSVGTASRGSFSPEGTAESDNLISFGGQLFSRPFGTRLSPDHEPNLERLGYCRVTPPGFERLRFSERFWRL